MLDGVTLEQIRAGASHDLISLYDDASDESLESDSPFQYSNSVCDYYEPEQFNTKFHDLHGSLSYFHLNCRGLSINWDSFRRLICDLHGTTFSFDILGISEIFKCQDDMRLSLPGYHKLITRCRDDGARGGVGLFIKENINFKIREDISVFTPHIFESLFIEIISPTGKNTVIGVVYRPNTKPRADIDIFSSTLFDIMDLINIENKLSIIMGDMNIDLLKFGSHTKTSDYLDNIFSRGFLPVITKPTRISTSSATLIDHIYTNNITTTGNSGIIITDVADHFGTFHISNIKNNNKSRSTNKGRLFSENNINKFKETLHQIDFQHVLAIMCPNEAYNEFYRLYKIAFETSFPFRVFRNNNTFIKREPWFTKGLLISSKRKSKLYSRKLHKPTERNINEFKQYNNMFNKLKRAMKIKYFSNSLEENKNNIKKTWIILRQAIGKLNNKSNFPHTFVINDIPVTNKLQAAEGFNNYFSKIGIQTSQNVPPSNKGFRDYMPRPVLNSMFIEPVLPSDVLSVATKLKPKSSCGHDDISTKLLKQTLDYIIQPITHIINRSFDTGIVPREMKIAKVIPIHKSSDPSLLKNYRPVSLLTAFSKLFEKLMFNKLISFLNGNNILFKHQYGFRSKHSTLHPIIHLLNHCAEVTNQAEPEFILAIFCDLSKAFDVISHDILLHKLNSYGIRGVANQWFESYLSDRSQFIELDKVHSSHLPIRCGVPQGSILGPLLYLIYVNDIYNSCKGNIVSFADDTTLYMSNSDVTQLFCDVNTQINNLFKWFCANKLSLNANKTKFIVIRPNHRQCDLTELHICIDGTPLKRIGNDCDEKAAKFLGIHIDEHLTWKYHIAHVNSKVARSLFFIKQVKNFLPSDSMRTLYFALVHSHYSYGLIAWGNACSTALHRSIILQKRALRIINNANYNGHTDPLFKASRILKLNDMYEHQALLFMFDFIENKLPISFTGTFKFNRDNPESRPTRQSNMFYIARCQLQFARRLPLLALPEIWNNKSKSIMNVNTISRFQFKHKSKTAYLNTYQSHVRCKNERCLDCYRVS